MNKIIPSLCVALLFCGFTGRSSSEQELDDLASIMQNLSNENFTFEYLEQASQVENIGASQWELGYYQGAADMAGYGSALVQWYYDTLPGSGQ